MCGWENKPAARLQGECTEARTTNDRWMASAGKKMRRKGKEGTYQVVERTARLNLSSLQALVPKIFNYQLPTPLILRGEYSLKDKYWKMHVPGQRDNGQRGSGYLSLSLGVSALAGYCGWLVMQPCDRIYSLLVLTPYGQGFGFEFSLYSRASIPLQPCVRGSKAAVNHFSQLLNKKFPDECLCTGRRDLRIWGCLAV